MSVVGAAVVVVASNRAAAGVYDDTTGPLHRRVPAGLGFDVDAPGRRTRRRARRRAPSPPPSTGGARVVLTTGGTGLTPTDLTPEVTRAAARPRGARHRRGDPRVRRRARASRPPRCPAAWPASPARPGRQPARVARRREGRDRGARAAARARRRADRRERPLSAPRRRRLAGGCWPRAGSRCGRWPSATPAPGARYADATPPGCAVGRDGPAGGHHGAATFRSLVRDCAGRPASGRALPFAVEVDGRVRRPGHGQQHRRRLGQLGPVGYWVDRRYAGRGVMPTAVALVVDHCFSQLGCTGSRSRSGRRTPTRLRVVEKLGFTEVGYAPRLPAHRRGLARPPDLRDHRRGVPGRPAGAGSRPLRARTDHPNESHE